MKALKFIFGGLFVVLIAIMFMNVRNATELMELAR